MKNLILCLFSGACLLVSAATLHALPLYQVSAPDKPVSYLMGTIHVEDARVLKQASRLCPAWDAVDVLALEIEPDMSAMMKLAGAMYYADGSNLKQDLGARRFAKIVEELSGQSLGMGEGILIKLKPWAALSMLSLPPPETGVFFDMKLYQLAVAAGKQVEALETVEEQIAFFEGLTLGEQIALIDDALQSRDDLPETLDKMTRLYLAGDLEKLASFSEDQMTTLDAATRKQFVKLGITDRNQRMFERLQPLLNQQPTLAAVGSLHLPGDGGLLELLEGAGWKVTDIEGRACD